MQKICNLKENKVQQRKGQSIFMSDLHMTDLLCNNQVNIHNDYLR